MNLLERYNSSMFQDFEIFLRTDVELFENDIKLA